jgi:hypothetical protein
MTLDFYGLDRVVPAFSGCVTIERPRAGAYDANGRWQDHGLDTLEIPGVVQTMGDKDLMNVDEGRRIKGGIKVYTVEPLRTASVDGSVQPDVIVWHGSKFQVENVVDWSEQAGYYRSTAIRMGQ